MILHRVFADDHWHLSRIHNGLGQTVFEPIILLAPGAQYDLGDNEALAVGTRLLFEQSTGLNLTLVQPVAGQTLVDVIQQAITAGFSPLLLAGHGWQTLDPEGIRQYPNQQWISIGAWPVDQVAGQTSVQLPIQQWQRSTDIAVLLYRQSVEAMTAAESGQWLLRLHPKLQDHAVLQTRILCYQQAIQAATQRPLTLQWQAPQVSESMLAATQVSLPGVADAQLLKVEDSASVQTALAQPSTTQTATAQAPMTHASIEWTLFLRTDFIAYQALLMNYEGRWQPNRMPIRATQGGWLFLNAQGEVLSPRYVDADQALCTQ